MPTVPNIPNPGATGPSLLDSKGPAPSPENLLMATATMHQMGKFDVPEASKGRKKGPTLKVVK